MLTFRLDDISANVNKDTLFEMTMFLKRRFEDCLVIYAVTVFSKANLTGSVYPDPPFKNNPHHFFYDVDQVYMRQNNGIETASHGLIHGDHSRLDYDAQEMSVVMSCKLLKADIFVPPFNRWNSTTEDVCRNNSIHLVKFEEGWKSLEHNAFDNTHELWYFHPWKWNFNDFKEAIISKKLGFLQGHTS